MVETNTHEAALVKKDSALTGAAVSAAVGVALYALRKALAEDGGKRSQREHEQRDEHEHSGNEQSMLARVWDTTSDAVLPIAEDAASAAGRWAATQAPAVVRERILPRFIDSFSAAA